MSSSLAQQLAQRNTLDSSRLATVQSLKHPPSFIFTPRHAAALTTSDLHALAVNAWDQLSATDPVFEKYQTRILGQEAKDTDRATLTKEENAKLDIVLEKVMRALGRHMLVKPAGVVLEWLVRRFRVNDLNIPALVALFLPYHTTPHFPSALALIPEKTLSTTPFSCLIPSRTSLAPLPLASLISFLPPFSSVPTARSFLDFILHLPLTYLEENEPVHRALISLWLQVLSGFLDRAGSKLGEGERNAVLSTLLDVIKQARSQPDMMITSYILLTRYALHHPLDADTLKVVLKHLVANRIRRDAGDQETDEAFVTTLMVVSQLGTGEIVMPEGKKFLGSSGMKSLLKVERLPELLIQLCKQYDAKRFMTPLLKTLAVEATQDESSLDVLKSLLTPRPDFLLPAPILALLTSSVLSSALLATPSSSQGLIKVLSQIYQRHSSVWETETTSRISSTSDADLPALWKIMNQVIGVGSDSTSDSLVLSTNSPDLAVRVLGLKQMLEDEKLKENNATFVKGVVRARLAEGKVELMKLLLDGDKGVEVLDADEIVEILAQVLEEEKLDNGVERLVEKYLTTDFANGHKEEMDDLVKNVIWRKVLRRKNSPGWKISGSPIASHPWLSGVTTTVKNDSEDEAIKINVALVDKIAKNISGLPADQLGGAIDFLLEKIAGKDVLASLVAAQLGYKLSKERQLNFVGKVLATLKVPGVGLDDFVPSNETNMDEAAVSQAVWSKPSAEKTLVRVKASLLLSAVGSIRSTQNVAWKWLSSNRKDEYAALATAIFKLAHTGSSVASTVLSTSLLDSLFSNMIGEDTLAFLASIWTSHLATELRLIALRDAAVYVGVVGNQVDFQTVVPTALVALLDKAESVRKAALDVLEKIKVNIPKSVTVVYGKDKFYGETSNHLKYLDVVDTAKYLNKLLEYRTEIAMDGAFLLTFHQRLLESAEPESSKKKTSLKVKIITFVLSHIASWTSISGRTLLLRSISGLKDSVKSGLLVPIVADLAKMEKGKRVALAQDVEEDVVVEYSKLLLQPYEDASKKWLENPDHHGLATFCEVLEISDLTGLGAIARKDSLAILRASLFASLRGDSRLDMLRRLVRLANDGDIAISSQVLNCLRGCKIDSATITSFLAEIRLSIASPVSKGAKRGRTSIGGAAGRTERLPELVILLESIDFTHVATSHALMLTLFDLLSTIMEIPSSAQIDIQYPGQLLLGALAKVVENTQPTSGITGDSIRMSPVLDFMRSSSNPQTSHQALLLLSQLGPLVPDQLVHNIMPIFTFMGANVLQRDDAYSLRVVEKTLESVVPALVKSKKRVSGNRDALLVDLKELLRVFTDAAAHVPRHRRITLFVRFVTTLGPSEFLSAVCMLLLAKGSKSLDKSALPLAVFESFPVTVQLKAVTQIIEESCRHLTRLDDESIDAPFLDFGLDTEGSRSVAEQTAELINFVALALEGKHLTGKIDAARVAGDQSVDLSLTEIVRGLLDLSGITPSTFTPNDLGEVSSAAGMGLQAAVRQMSTQAFSEAILWLLELSDAAIEARALALLRTRLPTIKPARRGDISPAVVTVVERLRSGIADKTADVDTSLDTLDVIVSSIYLEEDAVLAKTVPVLLNIALEKTTTREARATALSVVKKLCHRLGPRLIPLAGKVIPFTVNMLHLQAQDLATASSNIVTLSFEVLEGLFTSIPNFIGGQIDQVFDASLSSDILALTEDKSGAPAKARALMLSTATKRLPAKTLYPAIIRLHSTLDGQVKEPIVGLLDLLNRALRQGKTTDIAENYRPIFKLFLTVFDLRREHSSALSLDDVSQVEENALGAFVQFILKLNEQTFRPLFLRTYDWAVIDLGDSEDAEDGLVARRTILYKLVDKLLTQLKGIVVPYFSFMLDQTADLFDSFAKEELQNGDLWVAIISALTKALAYDEAGFWTPARLTKLSKPIAAQLESSQNHNRAAASSHYHPLLVAYAQALSPHEDVLKSFNSSLLMLTRSDDLKIKRGSLEALEQLWETMGDGMLGLVPETTPFLSEALEETEGGVEMVTRRLIGLIEERLGESLQSYLEN